ncbi:MAG TPA: hypothetical protein VLI67_00050, partial [Vicinamibacteria bacterium]|nr:hypothetical protein [Vicinamibacteria bacterium]
MELVEELEQAARARFVRWDPALWRDLVAGPARELAESLEGARLPAPQGQALLESYLRLGCEAIGLGYLVPGSSGASNF